MSNFRTRSNVSRLLLGVLILLAAVDAKAISACLDAYSNGILPIARWGELPSVIHSGLSDDLVQAVAKHPRIKSLRERFGEGGDLHFQLPTKSKGDLNGWAIQGEFFLKLLKLIFPKATLELSDEIKRNVIDLVILDSSRHPHMAETALDVVDFKILNNQPIALSRASVRKLLRLPLHAKIAALYFSWTYSDGIAPTMMKIFDTEVANIVVLSSQFSDAPSKKVEEALALARIPFYTSTEWMDLKERPERAVIFNQTRGRLRYIYAAADFAVVAGMANPLEPIHEGIPTYFSKFARSGFSEFGWMRLGNAAKATGLGQPFENENELAMKIGARTSDVASAAPIQIGEALENLLSRLERCIVAVKGPGPND